jgi:hypothetical protein
LKGQPSELGFMNISYFCRDFTGVSVATCLAVAASLCCSAPTDPQDLLTVDVTVTPSVVRPGDSLLVTLTIVNQTPFPLRLRSGDSCVALPVVHADGERVAWGGTGLGCYTAVSTFDVPGGGTLTREFPLVAFLQEGTAPWGYSVPPPPGTYDLVMDMHVQLADVVREIVVTN